ncbi:MAG: hypothetical protein AAF330_01635 [Pseudomonadota bacterium]
MQNTKTSYTLSAAITLVGTCGIDPTATLFIAAGLFLVASALCAE